MKKGFTLVELLAVIAILAILTTIGGVSVFGIIKNSRQKMLDESLKNIGDASVSYVQQNMSGGSWYLTGCSTSFDPKNPTLNSADSSCYKRIFLKDLIEANLFEVSNLNCNINGMIIVYRVKSGNYNEIKTYFDNSICTL